MEDQESIALKALSAWAARLYFPSLPIGYGPFQGIQKKIHPAGRKPQLETAFADDLDLIVVRCHGTQIESHRDPFNACIGFNGGERDIVEKQAESDPYSVRMDVEFSGQDRPENKEHEGSRSKHDYSANFGITGRCLAKNILGLEIDEKQNSQSNKREDRSGQDC